MKRQLTRTKQMNTRLRLKFSKLKKEASDPSLLDKHMNPLAAELFKNEIVNGERQAKGRMYTPAIKDFAIKCNFYSGSGYENLRSAKPGDPGLLLPSRRFMRNYVSGVQFMPGHLVSVMKTIQENIANKKHRSTCTLVIDEASLHKAQCWDPQLKSFMGMCTSIPGVDDSDEKLATQFLVFMLVGLDGLWRYPDIHWFTNHNSGEIVATLVRQSLKPTDEHEIDVRALVFDGFHFFAILANQRWLCHRIWLASNHIYTATVSEFIR